ncbi:hypothetical protein CKY51_03685 [Xanthomonas maliensis]|nr:hypothetical protein CKY51_03685 [Xanthomonas maliensis]
MAGNRKQQSNGREDPRNDPLPMKQWQRRKTRVINASMNAHTRQFYFWYYGFPMLLAEEGVRSP